jgi:hypothetical protein
MYMHSRLFAGEEVKPETGFPKDGRAHTFNCSVESHHSTEVIYSERAKLGMPFGLLAGHLSLIDPFETFPTGGFREA